MTHIKHLVQQFKSKALQKLTKTLLSENFCVPRSIYCKPSIVLATLVFTYMQMISYTMETALVPITNTKLHYSND